MKAGIDFGSTLAKVAWRTGRNSFCFISTATTSFEKLVALMKTAHITSVFTIGTTHQELGADFNVVRPTGNSIGSELAIQALGAQNLLKFSRKKLDTFLLVTMGTGTSYVLVEGANITPLLGNPLGFGAVSAIVRFVGIQDFNEFEFLASRGSDLHLRISDLFSDKAGTPEGEFLVSYFAKTEANSSKEDVCKSFIDMIAISTMIDLLRESEKIANVQNVVYVGSPIYSSPTLRSALQLHHKFLGKDALFPKYAMYAGALGALLVHESN